MFDPDALLKLFENPEIYASYLDFEEQYDSNTHVLGVGSIGAGGLLVTAIKATNVERMGGQEPHG